MNIDAILYLVFAGANAIAGLMQILYQYSEYKTKNKILAGAHKYTTTQYVCAAFHFGELNARACIEILEDRHHGKLLELGLNIDKVLHEAKIARQRNAVTSFSLFVILCIYFSVLIIFDAGNLLLNRWYWFSLFGTCIVLGIVEVIMINNHVRNFLRENGDSNREKRPRANVVIYGGYVPFAGYGQELDGFSNLFDITKSNKGDLTSKPEKFEALEVLNFISHRIKACIKNCDIQDKIFIPGQRLFCEAAVLDHPLSTPNVLIDERLIDEKIGNSSADARHYRVFSIPVGGGQAFLSFFIRIFKQEKNLYVEVKYMVLPPISMKYTKLNDLIAMHGIRYYFDVLLVTIKRLIPLLFRGIGYLVEVIFLMAKVIAEKILGNKEDKLKISSGVYNYGLGASFRERLMGDRFHDYFQKSDAEMNLKISKEVIFSALSEFLSAKGVAVDGVEHARSEVVNNGVMILGGSLNAGQLAVGPLAKIKNLFGGNKKKKE